MTRKSVISILSNILFNFIEVLLALRIFLKFFGANSLTPFVTWVYQTSNPLIRPFEGIFPAEYVEGRFILEISTLFALLVYGILGYIIDDGFTALEIRKAERK